MANNDELIYKGKALKDLRGIQDVLMSQGDPFLANIMNRAIECIENQPAAIEEPDHAGPAQNLVITRIFIDDDTHAVNVEMAVKLETFEPVEWWKGLTEYRLARTVAYKLKEYLCKWLGG